MNKPKHLEKRKIDEWVCCWCGMSSGEDRGFDYHKGWGLASCPHCGKQNRVYFSIEYMTQPLNDDGEDY